MVCSAKYRRAMFFAEVDAVLRDVCLEIASRYVITFLEIGTDRDHVHFLVQTIPAFTRTKLVRVIKSLTAREVFRRVPAVKEYLWGGEFWSDGCTKVHTSGPFLQTSPHHRYDARYVRHA